MSTFSIRIAKADREIQIDFSAFAPEVQAYVIRYGLTQALNDAASSVKSDETECAGKTMALVGKKLDAMKRGELRAHGERAPRDPVAAEALRLASDAIARIPAFAKAKPAAIRETAKRYADRFLDQARENVAKAAVSAALVGDLVADLMDGPAAAA